MEQSGRGMRKRGKICNSEVDICAGAEDVECRMTS